MLGLVSEVHGGKLYDSEFGQRMRGRGVHADLIAQREAKPKGKAKKSETREEPQQTGFDRQEGEASEE